MNFLQAILLGLVQGLTEFIPISSSAHLIIVPWLFGWEDKALTSLTFDVALHLGTLLALLVFFAGDWVRLIRAGVASIVERRMGDDHDRRMAWFLVVGCIPGAIVGALGREQNRTNTRTRRASSGVSQIAMAVIIALLGGALFLAERLARHLRRLSQITFKDSLLIGLAQALAIFPGVSRSGSTITAGLALGLEREAAARFSFLLSAPIIAGAGLKSLWEIAKDIQTGALAQSDLILFPIGFIVAAVSGYLCIKYLLRFLQKEFHRPLLCIIAGRWPC
jgi:undecaprenyl-diphosphatase